MRSLFWMESFRNNHIWQMSHGRLSQKVINPIGSLICEETPSIEERLSRGGCLVSAGGGHLM